MVRVRMLRIDKSSGNRGSNESDRRISEEGLESEMPTVLYSTSATVEKVKLQKIP